MQELETIGAETLLVNPLGTVEYIIEDILLTGTFFEKKSLICEKILERVQ